MTTSFFGILHLYLFSVYIIATSILAATNSPSTSSSTSFTSRYTNLIASNSPSLTISNSSVPSCTITCCQNCTGTICTVCYQKYGNKPDICPCVTQGSEIQASSQAKPNAETISPPYFLNNPLSLLTADLSTGDGKVPICRPSCCPHATCTKSSCPACYKRYARNVAACPCVNTGSFSDRKHEV
eukprot:GFUD01062353.1.p1 GENE.GFUD01062353.1~~GFUD01062353.1.p1  ORF type:complete len:184 (+),score=34.49 GFUD01062353.1:89-640(+)